MIQLIKGMGIDIVEIERVKKAYLRFPEKFMERIFTPPEKAYIFSGGEPYRHLAARFAAKEAVMKALGCGWGAAGFREIEIINQDSGKPEIVLTGKATSIAEKQEIKEVIVSLSHCQNYAVAQAIAW